MGERPEDNRQELRSALEAVTTSFTVGRPVSPADPVPAADPGPVDGKQQLATAYAKLVEHEAAKPTALVPVAPPKWKRFVQPAIITISMTAAIYLTAARPVWLYPPFAAPSVPMTEAIAEQMLVATSLLVDLHLQETGRFPANLDEIPGSFPAVSYRDTGDGSYQLFVTVQTRQLVMTVRPGEGALLEGQRQ